MVSYGIGECANSLVMNGIFGFAMLFYTKALGLQPEWAGLAMSVSIFWEAFTEPVMGHISDNTRSRWGRRHPYMIVGGALMALCSYLIWAVPVEFRTSQMSIFWYLVSVNLLLRTGLTLFCIPYGALGFEMCNDYHGRSKLQGTRSIINMIANFAGPAMAWTFFFEDKDGVQATTVAANYLRMGSAFAVATAISVCIVVILTFHWHEDTRQAPSRIEGGGIGGFLRDMKQIILDPYPRWVFVFIVIITLATGLVGFLQIFVYDDFMRFPAVEKSIAHGGTMAGFALGSALAIGLSKRFDRRGTVFFGCLVSACCNIILAVLFLTGWVATNAVWHWGAFPIPAALILFVIFNTGYWMGIGILGPMLAAMVSDIAEIHLLQTGENKDGGYAAVSSLAGRVASSFSFIVMGWSLNWIGYKVPTGAGKVVQTGQALWNLGMVTFVIGAVIAALASLAIWKYPVNKKFLEDMRAGSPKSASGK
ncbi:MAG: MFS transporter [Methylacidiphilales bacterium]|nr:MFS transporter [Candidatus Methylacidiphilales bacterium]